MNYFLGHDLFVGSQIHNLPWLDDEHNVDYMINEELKRSAQHNQAEVEEKFDHWLLAQGVPLESLEGGLYRREELLPRDLLIADALDKLVITVLGQLQRRGNGGVLAESSLESAESPDGKVNCDMVLP